MLDSTFGADPFCPRVLCSRRSVGQILTEFHVNVMPLEATLYTEHYRIVHKSKGQELHAQGRKVPDIRSPELK